MNPDCGGEIQPWPDLGSQSVGNFRIFQLRSVRRRSPRNGVERDFYVMDCADWVNVIAITAENELVLVEQFRHGVAAVELEVPGGIMDPGEIDPVAAGLRELREETGYVGEGGIEIGCVLSNSAIQSNRCRTVLVRQCRRVGELELDDSEDIAARLFPVSEGGFATLWRSRLCIITNSGCVPSGVVPKVDRWG